MTCPQSNRLRKLTANDYATAKDFCSVFAEGLNDLYQLSLLLTGDHERAEQCFVAGLEQCTKANEAFRNWARSWAKRIIIQIAIRELKPRQRVASPFLIPLATRRRNLPRDVGWHFGLAAILALEDFERFVFVMSVLERYSEHDCALLLGCTRRQVNEARSAALVQLMDSELSLKRGELSTL